MNPPRTPESIANYFMLTAGGALHATGPDHGLAHSLSRDLVRVGEVEIPDDLSPLSVLYDHIDMQSAVYDEFWQEGAYDMFTTYGFKDMVVRRVGDMTIRCIRGVDLYKDKNFKDTSEEVHDWDLVIATSLIPPEERRNATVVYGAESLAGRYLSGVSAIGVTAAVLPGEFDKLRRSLDAAEEALEVAGFQPPKEQARRQDPEASEEFPIESFEQLQKRAASKGKILKSGTEEVVTEIGFNVSNAWQDSLERHAQIVVENQPKKGPKIKLAEACERLAASPIAQEALDNIMRGFILQRVGTIDDPDALSDVWLCRKELFEYTIPTFAVDESDLPVQIAHNSDYDVRIMHYKDKAMMVAASPLSDYSYLRVFDESKGEEDTN